MSEKQVTRTGLMNTFVNDVKNYPRCCSDFQKSAGGLKVGAPKPREERIPGKIDCGCRGWRHEKSLKEESPNKKIPIVGKS